MGAWLLASLVVVLALEMWGPKLYYFTTYVGFLIAIEYSEPQVDRPHWHRRLDLLSVTGFFGFVYIVITWIEQVIGAGIL